MLDIVVYSSHAYIWIMFMEVLTIFAGFDDYWPNNPHMISGAVGEGYQTYLEWHDKIH